MVSMYWLKRRLLSILILAITANIWYLGRHAKRSFPTQYDASSTSMDRHEGENHVNGKHEKNGSSDSLIPEAATYFPYANQNPMHDQKFSPSYLPRQYQAGMEVIMETMMKMLHIHPNIKHLCKYNRNIMEDSGLLNDGDMPATSDVLAKYLQVDRKTVGRLRSAHKSIVQLLPQSIPAESFMGRGIVMTGGGKYFPMVLHALRWLREVNPTIPVEVFMQDSSEYECTYCDEAFPKLGARCIVADRVLSSELMQKVSSKYALKPLAILASRFEHIYFMDADSLPLSDPEPVFDAPVYIDTGMILNRDYWERYASPHFYEIANVRLGGRVRGSPEDGEPKQCDRENAIPGKSTESGQIYVQKSRHIRSLLLTLYYNLYGDTIFFPLLMQGGQGEGDKDTYAAAATILGEDFYQTDQGPGTLGHWGTDSFHGMAMLQPDSRLDYRRTVLGDASADNQWFVLHANMFKANPKYMLMDHSNMAYEEEKYGRGFVPLRQGRYFGDLSGVLRETHNEEDLELRFFKVMTDTVCDWGIRRGWVPRDWENVDLEIMCMHLQDHVKWLSENPSAGGVSEGKFYVDRPPHGSIPPKGILEDIEEMD